MFFETQPGQLFLAQVQAERLNNFMDDEEVARKIWEEKKEALAEYRIEVGLNT